MIIWFSSQLGSISQTSRTISNFNKRGAFTRLDLRTRSMVYSKRTPSAVTYNLYHAGKVTELKDLPADAAYIESSDIFSQSRYGYSFSGSNDPASFNYFDESTMQMESGLVNLPPRLGQYEQLPGNVGSITIAKIPDKVGMSVSTGDSIMVSMDMPDGTTVNYYSSAPMQELSALLQRPLTGITVNPMMAR